MHRFTLSLLVATQIFAQTADRISERDAAARLQLASGTLVRADRSGDKLVAVDAENQITVYSAVSGAVESQSQLQLASSVRDFETDQQGSVYLLSNDGVVAKWRAQNAGFEFTTRLEGTATAIGVDARGDQVFVAVDGGIWLLNSAGEVTLRSIAKVDNVTKLRFDDNTGVLYAEGKDYIGALPASLDRIDIFASGSGGAGRSGVFRAASSSNNRAAAQWTIGMRIEPAFQTVNPGGTAIFTIRSSDLPTSQGPYAFSYESPIAGVLSRNFLLINDAISLQIPIPANQAPGVYRVVGKLDNGANGYASAVFAVPFPGSTNIPLLGTGRTTAGQVASGQIDPNYHIVNPFDPSCSVATVAFRGVVPVGNPWFEANNSAFWISGRADSGAGCQPGIYRFRTDIDLRDFDPATANIAVAVLADNAATLEINGTPIPGEPQTDGEAEPFKIARVYAIPRETLRRGSNSLDFVVSNDPFPGSPVTAMGLRVEILSATAKPIASPEPPPVGDFWLSLSPPFKYVNGTTAYYTVNINRLGGFAGTPTLQINDIPPTGYSAIFNGNVLQITRDPNVTTAQTTWRFAVLGVFSQTTRSVDGAFIQNPLVPVDLPLVGTGVVNPGVTAPPNSVDTHYTLVSTPDANFPGPSAFVANELTSPIGPWVLNDQFSRWIAPRPDAGNSNTPGLYRYQTTFDLGLGSPESGAIALRWAADNDARIYLNGTLVAGALDAGNFRRLNETLITSGFQPGINVLEFAVNNLDLGGPSPQGLRVEVVGAQSARNPNRVVQVLRGRTSTGPVPLYAGSFTYTAPVGVVVTSNNNNLLFSATDAAPLGVFPVRVTFNSNFLTQEVQLVIGAREAVPYIVNSTGQADEGTIDPNYRMVESADQLFLPPNAYVILSNTSPVSLGYWAKNNINSRWISARTDTLLPNAPGAYRFRTTFDLTGRNIGDAMLALEWAADNRGRIELNGNIVDETLNGDGYKVMKPVSITSGFKTGVNTLDFVVINEGPGVSPLGLQVSILGAYAVSTGTAPGPDFSITPDPGVKQIDAGQPAVFNLRVTPNFTFNQNEAVEFSVVNPPAGFTFTFLPVRTTVSTNLTIQSSAQLPRGQYPITIRGRWGDIIRETQVRVDILNSAAAIVIASTGGASIGSVDPNYKLIDALGLSRETYVADLTEATIFWSSGKWIAPTKAVEARAAAGTYRYRTTFNVFGFNPSSIVVDGTWDADDTVVAVLNGVVVATLEKPFYLDPGILHIATGFKAGLNELDFVVTNNSPSPTGLMVKINSITAAPLQ